MDNNINKSVWSGVFFPADEPEQVSLPAEEPQNAPLDTADVVETNFEVERQDISEDTSVTNEVEDTPAIETVDEVEEQIVELSDVESEPVQQTAATEDVAVENVEVSETVSE
jgi:hypothetical protein